MPVGGAELPLGPFQFAQGRFEFGVARLQVGRGPVGFPVGFLGALEQQLPPPLIQCRILQGHGGLTGQDGQHRAIGGVEGPMLRCPCRDGTGDPPPPRTIGTNA